MSGTTAEKMRQLREALGLTQTELAERSGFSEANPAYISKIETGKNALSGTKSRVGIARGFGLTERQLTEYLEGAVTLTQTVARCRAISETETKESPAIADDAGKFEVALAWAFEKERHTIRDIAAVQAALRSTAQMADPSADLTAAAREWLDAAARLRKRGLQVTTETLLLEVTLGSKTRATSPTAQALETDVQNEWQGKLEEHNKTR